MEVKASVGLSYALSHRKAYPKPTFDEKMSTDYGKITLSNSPYIIKRADVASALFSAYKYLNIFFINVSEFASVHF